MAEPVTARAAASKGFPTKNESFARGGSRSVGTQSLYRETEAQTTPWEPAYVLPAYTTIKQEVHKGMHHVEIPEIAYLQHLTFGDGLPGGLQEVNMVKKLREKRAFEASLPPITDVKRLPERQRMLEAWETKEWREREEEIASVQEERLEILREAMERR